MVLFRDRRDAGQRLAGRLEYLRGRDCLVLAVPRGGVVVADEVAARLNAPLDLIIPRKIGAPGNPELAIGAVAPDGTVVIREEILDQRGVSREYVEEAARQQLAEINRRLCRYRGDNPPPAIKGRVVILVDDGIATGHTMRAALLAVRKEQPTHVVLAVPVAPPEALEELRDMVDEIACLVSPHDFWAVGQFYQAFDQTSDREVTAILARYNFNPAIPE